MSPLARYEGPLRNTDDARPKKRPNESPLAEPIVAPVNIDDLLREELAPQEPSVHEAPTAAVQEKESPLAENAVPPAESEAPSADSSSSHKPKSRPVGMSSESFAVLREKYKDSADVDVLLRQLEEGEVTPFDARSIQLLKENLQDPSKRAIVARLLAGALAYRGRGSGFVTGVATAAAGLGAGGAAAIKAYEYGESYAMSYILASERMMQFNAKMAFIAQKLVETVGPLKTHLDNNRVAYETAVGTAAQGTNMVIHGTKEVIKYAMGSKTPVPIPRPGEIFEKTDVLMDALGVVKKTAVGVKGAGVTAAGTAAAGVGYATGTFGLIGGWLLGSAVAGGAIGLARELYEAGSFVRLRPLVQASDYLVSYTERGGVNEKGERLAPPPRQPHDPRVELLAMEESIALDKKRQGFKLSNEELVALAAAAHRARASLYREMTMSPKLFTEDLHAGLEAQKQRVEFTIHANALAVTKDQAKTMELCGKFGTQVKGQMIPVQEESAIYNSFWERFKRNRKATVNGAFTGTRLPALYHAVGVGGSLLYESTLLALYPPAWLNLARRAFGKVGNGLSTVKNKLTWKKQS